MHVPIMTELRQTVLVKRLRFSLCLLTETGARFCCCAHRSRGNARGLVVMVISHSTDSQRRFVITGNKHKYHNHGFNNQFGLVTLPACQYGTHVGPIIAIWQELCTTVGNVGPTTNKQRTTCNNLVSLRGVTLSADNFPSVVPSPSFVPLSCG